MYIYSAETYKFLLHSQVSTRITSELETDCYQFEANTTEIDIY
jgi:hypothetical protein